MREYSIIKKAQNILYISLGDDWGSRERGILRDGGLAKEGGRVPFLYCYKNSPIARESARIGMATIHPNKMLSGSFKWRIPFILPGILRQYNIDLIHFYQMELVWPLCCLLYRFIEIPLVLSQCNEIDKFYTNIFHRTLIYRVDLFLSPLAGLKQNVASHLAVRSKKIVYCGMAPLSSGVVDFLEEAPRREKNIFYMGVLFNGNKSEEQHARLLFRALAVFNQKMDRPVFLELISERPWKEDSRYPFYKKLSWEYQVGDWISFEENNAMLKKGLDFDLWLGMTCQEDLEDCTLWAVICGVPILVPRTGASMEFFESYGSSGEYYKSGDGREFWQKGLEMLRNIDFYKNKLKTISEEVRKSCDASAHGKRILELYDGIKTRRWAYKGRMSRDSRT